MYGGNLVSILLVGIGGWGNTYVDALLSNLGRGDFRIAGAVDPNPQNLITWISNEMGIPIFSSMEEFYAVSKADLTVVSSPIHFHCEQTCTALAQGSNVLCEKPVSATIQEARQMIEARDKAGKIVAVGYQWSYSNAIRGSKRHQCGLFGSQGLDFHCALAGTNLITAGAGRAGYGILKADGYWTVWQTMLQATTFIICYTCWVEMRM